MSHADTVGIAVLLGIGLFIGVGLIVYGIVTSRRPQEMAHSFEDLRSIDRTYDPTSDAGFGVRNANKIVQDPNGYWRTSMPYEAPLGVARVVPRPSVPRQLALPAGPTTGRHASTGQTSLLGLFDDETREPISRPMYPTSPAPQPRTVRVPSYAPRPLPAPVAMPMSTPEPIYPPMTRDEFDSIVPTSPPVPSAHHYRPSVARESYAPGTFDPAASPMPVPVFNPLGQPVVEAEVSRGRHSWISNKGTDSQRAALRDNTMALPVIDMRELLSVG